MAKQQDRPELEVVQPIPDSLMQFVRRAADNAMVPLDPDNKDCRKVFKRNNEINNALRLDQVKVIERRAGDREKLELPRR